MSPLPIHRWTDAYVALKHGLEELRGFVEIESDGAGPHRWPRTTGQDVIAIAAVLDERLRRAPTIYGTDNLRRRWRACTDDLERYASTEPRSVYPENRAFWSTALLACVHLDSAEQPPPEAAFWEAFLLDFEQSAAHFRNADGGSAEDAYFDQHREYLRKRGIDDRYPKPTFPWVVVPRTTNTDAIVLATFWTNRITVAHAQHAASLDAAANAWNDCLAKVAAATKGAASDTPYADNQALWSCVRALAYAIDSVDVVHAATSLIGKAGDLVSGVFDDLPGSLEYGAGAVAHGTGKVLGELAGGFGDVAGKVAKGFLGELTTPLLVVGGGVAALYLLTRNHDHHEEA
jgi:hypothetical protein